MKKILYLVAEGSYFCSHRLELAAFMQQQGYIVAVATSCAHSIYKDKILQKKLQLFELRFFCRASCTNPFKEILALKELYSIYQKFKPDIVHHVALKPVIYGTLVAKFTKVNKIVNALGGLGFIFTEFNYKFNTNNIINFWKNININLKQKILRSIVYKILKITIINNKQQNKILLLQNQDDLDILKKVTNVNNMELNTAIIAGSGLNVAKYYPSEPLSQINFIDNKIKIVLISRLLWTKGIYEFVQAATKIKDYINKNNLNINPEFILYGDIDHKNPAAVDYLTLKQWQDAGLIIWKNFCHDMVSAYRDCHIAVLPSYREGLPKTLLEAAACARAIITTDVPGCREVVIDGVNGYLVPKQNSDSLANALLKLMQNKELMVNMGKLGRQRMCDIFAEQIIFPQTLEVYLS